MSAAESSRSSHRESIKNTLKNCKDISDAYKVKHTELMTVFELLDNLVTTVQEIDIDFGPEMEDIKEYTDRQNEVMYKVEEIRLKQGVDDLRNAYRKLPDRRNPRKREIAQVFHHIYYNFLGVENTDWTSGFVPEIFKRVGSGFTPNGRTYFMNILKAVHGAQYPIVIQQLEGRHTDEDRLVSHFENKTFKFKLAPEETAEAPPAAEEGTAAAESETAAVRIDYSGYGYFTNDDDTSDSFYYQLFIPKKVINPKVTELALASDYTYSPEFYFIGDDNINDHETNNNKYMLLKGFGAETELGEYKELYKDFFDHYKDKFEELGTTL